MRGVLAIVLFIFALGINGEQSKAQEVVEYRPELGNVSPALDVYSFAGAKNAPVIIYIHGGAWQRGSRKQVGRKPDHYNRLGYIFVSIDYRLVPKVGVEGQLDDIDHALGWISENIGRYGGDPQNLHLMGHSAGAHLVAMGGVKPGNHGHQLIADGALRTIIANDTLAYDIPLLAKRRGGQLHRLHQIPFGNDADRWRRLSPVHQLTAGSRLPDFMILYSGAGFSGTRKAVASKFVEALSKTGSDVVLFDGSKYSHRQMTTWIGNDNDLTAAIDSFLKSRNAQ